MGLGTDPDSVLTSGQAAVLVRGMPSIWDITSAPNSASAQAWASSLGLAPGIALASVLGCAPPTALASVLRLAPDIAWDSVLGLAPGIAWVWALTLVLTTIWTSFSLSAPPPISFPAFFSGLAWALGSISAPVIVPVTEKTQLKYE
ncbi:unnamed protein product [Pipistrellus nathusii]|uniref:Uncharacterized protein n=1 Tax=Pipistrellus nathusii TaxID=59473 RepID=A0ABP0AGB0_PIPNA